MTGHIVHIRINIVMKVLTHACKEDPVIIEWAKDKYFSNFCQKWPN